MLVFLICGLILNSIIGMLIYFFIVIITAILLEKQTVIKVIEEIKIEGKKIAYKIKNRRGDLA